MVARWVRATLEALVLWAWFAALAAWTGLSPPLAGYWAVPIVYLSAVTHHALGQERFSERQGRWLSVVGLVILMGAFFLLGPRSRPGTLLSAGLIFLAWWRGIGPGTEAVHPGTLEERGQWGLLLLMALIVTQALVRRPALIDGAAFLTVWLVLFALARVAESSRAPRRTRVMAAAGAGAGIALIAGLVTLLLTPGLWRAVASTLGRAIEAVFMLLGWAGAGFLWLITRVLKQNTSARLPGAGGRLVLHPPPRTAHLLYLHLSPAVRGALGVALAAVLVFLLLVLLWRSYHRTVDRTAQALEETREALGPSSPPPAAPAPPPLWTLTPLEGGPVGRVRRAYRAFLDLGSQHGRARRQSQTPREYARVVRELWPDSALLALTAVYETARYAGRCSASEAEAAEASLAELRGVDHHG